MVQAIPFLVLVFFVIVGTGPDAVAWRKRRRTERMALEDFPRVGVKYLPSAACREGCPQHRGEYPCLGLTSRE